MNYITKNILLSISRTCFVVPKVAKLELLANAGRVLKCCLIFGFVFALTNQELVAQNRSFETNDRLTLGQDRNLSASVRLGDLNGDGTVDAVVANGRHWAQQNFLFLNQGGAKFNLKRRLSEDMATTYATELADLDGDGDLDVAVSNDNAPNQILFNDGKGNFSKHSGFGRIASTRSMTAGDLDKDGDVDLVVTCRQSPNYYCLNDGKGNFGKAVSFGEQRGSTVDIAISDLNSDGHNDLILANRDEQQNYILLNDGKLNFRKKIKYGRGFDETRGIAIGDLNGDKYPDLVTANIGQKNYVYLNDGAGELVEAASFGDKSRSYAISLADMDNDGKLDIIVANNQQRNLVLFNLGVGNAFRQVEFGQTDGAAYGLSVGDLNGDGLKDIVVANSGQKNLVFINN